MRSLRCLLLCLGLVGSLALRCYVNNAETTCEAGMTACQMVQKLPMNVWLTACVKDCETGKKALNEEDEKFQKKFNGRKLFNATSCGTADLSNKPPDTKLLCYAGLDDKAIKDQPCTEMATICYGASRVDGIWQGGCIDDCEKLKKARKLERIPYVQVQKPEDGWGNRCCSENNCNPPEKPVQCYASAKEMLTCAQPAQCATGIADDGTVFAGCARESCEKGQQEAEKLIGKKLKDWKCCDDDLCNQVTEQETTTKPAMESSTQKTTTIADSTRKTSLAVGLLLVGGLFI